MSIVFDNNLITEVGKLGQFSFIIIRDECYYLYLRPGEILAASSQSCSNKNN